MFISEKKPDTEYDIALKQKQYDDWLNGTNENFNENSVRERRKKIVFDIIDGELTEIQRK